MNTLTKSSLSYILIDKTRRCSLKTKINPMLRSRFLSVLRVSVILLLGSIFFSPLFGVLDVRTQGEPSHPSEGLPFLRWSDPATWGGALPDENTQVIIPKDRRIALDTNAVAKNIIVRGTLQVADTGDYSLDTGWLLVDGGAFKVGTPQNPFTNEFTFTIQDYDPTASVNCSNSGGHYFFKNHFVGAYGGSTMHGAGQTKYCNSNGDPDAVGKISIHAADTKTEWTQLDGTMEQGATQLSVLDATGWKVGDELAIASTDYDHRQTEERTIVAVSGNDITLDAPVEYMHFGAFTYGVDQRGEVANLTRNVTFQTDPILAQTESSAQTFLDKVTRSLKVKRLNFFVTLSAKAYIDGIAIDQAGQEGQLGKYPFHWHHTGNTTGQYVRNSVFSHSLNKCISVHVSSGATIENNVGYMSAGHCFYLEHDETSEIRSQENLFRDNLSLETNIPLPKQRVKDYDNLAAGFWVTHPNNRFVGNVAGGAGELDGTANGSAQRDGGNGFWLEITETDKTPKPGLTQFDDNRSHSNSSTAFWVNTPGRYNHTDDIEINNFVAYKNRISNMWVRVMSSEEKNLTINNSQFADSLSGVYFASDGVVNNHSVGEVKDSLFVGETENKGTVVAGYDQIVGVDGRTVPLNRTNMRNRGENVVRAIEIYDGISRYDGNTFVNFETNAQRPGAILSPSYNIPYALVPQVPVSNSTVIDSNVAYFQNNFWELGARTSIYHDVDGTLTGEADSWITSSHPTIRETEHCTRVTAWNGFHCVEEGRSYGLFRIFNEEPYNFDFHRLNAYRRSTDQHTFLTKIERTERWNRHYFAPLTLNEWYDFEDYTLFDQEIEGYLSDVDFMLQFVNRDDDWLGFSYRLDEYPTDLQLLTTADEELTEKFSQKDVESAQTSAFYYDYDAARVYFKLYARNSSDSVYSHAKGNINYQDKPPAKGRETVFDLQLRHPPIVQNDATLTLPVANAEKRTNYAYRNIPLAVCNLESPSVGTATVTTEARRNILYTPPSDYVGEVELKYDLCTDSGQTVLRDYGDTVTVTAANERPELDVPALEILQNAAAVSVPYTVEDTDNNYDLETGSTLEVKKSPEHGTLAVVEEELRYTPETDYTGRDEAVVQACDSLNGCDLSVVIVDVGNSAPEARDDETTLDENQSVTLEVLANDTDADSAVGDTLGICTVDGYDNVEFGTLELQDNAFVYTPNPGYFGADTFRYRVCDTNGARDEAEVRLTVLETDGLPYANLDEVVVNEDESVTFNPVENDYSNNGRDLCAPNPFAEPTHGSLTQAGNELTYTPDPDFAGEDSFAYRVCDADQDESEGRVRIIVESVNDLPVAVPDTISIQANEIGIITPITNDYDLEGALLLICEEDALTQPNRGVAYRESDTLISYQPNENETYTDTFTYRLCEEDGADSTGTITIEVTKHTLAPVAVDDRVQGETNQTLTIDALVNDSDLDSGFALCDENGFAQPAYGTVTFESEVFVYTPEQDYTGEDEFTYTLCDPDGNQATGIVSVTLVAPTPDLPPVLQDQTLQAYPGNEFSFEPLADLTVDEDIESVTYTLAGLDADLGCTLPETLTFASVLACTPTIGITPNQTFTFTITPTDASQQVGEAATFGVEILPLLNPTLTLEATPVDTTRSLKEQEVAITLTLKNHNTVPVRDVQASLYIESNFARFAEEKVSHGGLFQLPAHASVEITENTLQKDFTLATLEPLESRTLTATIVPIGDSLGPVRAEAGIAGLAVDKEMNTLEDYTTTFVETPDNSTQDENSTPVLPGVVTTPRTGGSENPILLGIIAVVAATLVWLALRNRRVK